MRRQVIAISVLLNDCPKAYAKRLAEKIQEQLATDEINGSVGISVASVPAQEDD